MSRPLDIRRKYLAAKSVQNSHEVSLRGEGKRVNVKILIKPRECIKNFNI